MLTSVISSMIITMISLALLPHGPSRLYLACQEFLTLEPVLHWDRW